MNVEKEDMAVNSATRIYFLQTRMPICTQSDLNCLSTTSFWLHT